MCIRDRSKSGYGEKIYKMANNNRLLYDLTAIFFAIIFGLIIHETTREIKCLKKLTLQS